MAKRVGPYNADELGARSRRCRYPVTLHTAHVNSTIVEWLDLDEQVGRYCIVYGSQRDSAQRDMPIGPARIFFSHKNTAFAFKMRWI